MPGNQDGACDAAPHSSGANSSTRQNSNNCPHKCKTQRIRISSANGMYEERTFELCNCSRGHELIRIVQHIQLHPRVGETTTYRYVVDPPRPSATRRSTFRSWRNPLETIMEVNEEEEEYSDEESGNETEEETSRGNE